MNKATRDIMALLKVDAETALKVQGRMESNGLDFSECSQREFNRAARAAHKEMCPIHECWHTSDSDADCAAPGALGCEFPDCDGIFATAESVTAHEQTHGSGEIR